jgi:hypothetical protein
MQKIDDCKETGSLLGGRRVLYNYSGIQLLSRHNKSITDAEWPRRRRAFTKQSLASVIVWCHWAICCRRAFFFTVEGRERLPHEANNSAS